MSWRWDPPQGKREQLPSSPHRSERYHCLGMGHVAGCRGRASADCIEPSMGWVRGGTSVEEKEGSNWFREEQMWESRGEKGIKWPVPCKQVASWCACMQVMLPSNKPRRRDLWGAVSKEVALFYKIFPLVINCFISCFALAQHSKWGVIPTPKQQS